MNATIHRHPRLSNGEVPVPVASLDVLDAAYHTAHDFPGGVPALAQRMAQSANTLNHKVSLRNSTHHLMLVESVKMQEIAKDYRVLHAMAATLGHVAISMRTTDGMTMECVRGMVKEFSDMLAAVTLAEADTTITPNEFLACEREAAELIASINALVASMRGRLPRGRE